MKNPEKKRPHKESRTGSISTSPPRHTKKAKKRHLPRRSSVSSKSLQYPFLKRCRGLPSTQRYRERLELRYEIFEVISRPADARVRREHRYDLRCPFCSFQQPTFEKLKIHLPRFHRDHHDFRFSTIDNGICEISAVPTRAYLHEKLMTSPPPGVIPKVSPFQFIRIRGDSRQRYGKRVSKLRRVGTRSIGSITGSVGQPLDPFTTSCLDRRMADPWLVPSWIRNFEPLKPYKRTYYHHKTMHLPIRPGDCDFDSEDESRMEWVEQYGDGAIWDFEDCDEHEKRFMIVWNRFFRHTGGVWFIPEKNLAFVDWLHKFVRENIDELVDLDTKLMLKLMTLVEECRISDFDFEQVYYHYRHQLELKGLPHCPPTEKDKKLLAEDKEVSKRLQHDDDRKLPAVDLEKGSFHQQQALAMMGLPQYSFSEDDRKLPAVDKVHSASRLQAPDEIPSSRLRKAASKKDGRKSSPASIIPSQVRSFYAVANGVSREQDEDALSDVTFADSQPMKPRGTTSSEGNMGRAELPSRSSRKRRSRPRRTSETASLMDVTTLSSSEEQHAYDV